MDRWSPLMALAEHHRDAAGQILHCIEEGTYCALLGPHSSGKTLLIRSVEEHVAQRWPSPCIYIDLSRLEASTQRGFFGRLASLTAGRLAELTGLDLPAPDAAVGSGAAFRGFLTEMVSHMQRDLVLLIDHLEAMPTDLVQALLTSLRAAYMEHQTLDHRLMVVTSGALSLASLAVGESSPFRGIARRVFVGDLSIENSWALIDQQLASANLVVSDAARHRLLEAAGGDPYLIRKLCQDVQHTAEITASRRVTARSVNLAAARFLEGDVHRYTLLQEAVRSIEDDPDLVRCILLLLEHGALPRSELPLPLSPDVDPLYLTGVVQKADKDHYRLRNEIYRRFLASRLDPGRVGHLLTIAGRWDSAIDYLEASIRQGNEHYRADLLPATIHSIYASEDLGHAAHFLLRGLFVAFGVEEAEVWMVSPHENSMHRVGYLGANGDAAASPRSTLHLQEDCLEARAYREAMPLRGGEEGGGVTRAIPLLAGGSRPVGVVRFCDWLGNRFIDQRERELQMMGYLNQVARALFQVSRRTQELALAGRVQATLLPPIPEMSGWQVVATLQPARVVSGDFYDFISLPNARLGLVMADVADKGMGAALYMALSRTLLRTYAEDCPDQPAQVVGAVSRRILQDARAGLFVTAFYGILDPVTGRLAYCNAGHHPPVLVRAQGPDSLLELPRTGMALGAVEEATWRQETVQLQPGDALLLYTDGVPDAQNRERGFFGHDRILQVAREQAGRPAGDLLDAMLRALREFVGSEPAFDDITIVVVRRLTAAEQPPVEYERRARVA